MIQRKDVPVNDEYSVAVVTEDMADGRWAVVATIKHRSPSGGEQIVDLPVQDERYADQRQAEEAGIAQARAWLTHNVSSAA
jgi:hypothetical protein